MNRDFDRVYSKVVVHGSPSPARADAGSTALSHRCGTVAVMHATPTFGDDMDEQALRIHELIVGTCVASQPAGVLLHTRAELLALAEETGDPDAADAACGAVAEIDRAVSAAFTDVPQRRAS